MGPGTHVLERMRNKILPINSLDSVAFRHDLDYANDIDPIKADIHAIARTMPVSTLDKIWMIMGLGARTYGDYELRKANIGFNPLKSLAGRTEYTQEHKAELKAKFDDYKVIDNFY